MSRSWDLTWTNFRNYFKYIDFNTRICFHVFHGIGDQIFFCVIIRIICSPFNVSQEGNMRTLQFPIFSFHSWHFFFFYEIPNWNKNQIMKLIFLAIFECFSTFRSFVTTLILKLDFPTRSCFFIQRKPIWKNYSAFKPALYFDSLFYGK